MQDYVDIVDGEFKFHALLRWRDCQFPGSNQGHDVLVIRVGWVQRHEAGHAVDVNADAGVNAIKGNVLSVGVHGLEFRCCCYACAL